MSSSSSSSSSLLESSLIIFKAPPGSRLCRPCTSSTLRNIEKITALADYTRGIDIVCTPNIWAQGAQNITWGVSTKQSNLALEESDAITSSNDSILSSMSLVSSKSQLSWPDDNDYFVPTESSANPIPFQRSFSTSAGARFDVCGNSRFFVIKSYSALDVQASMANRIWASTELGNKRLDKAYREASGGIYLFFSVNSSAKFCGVAKMIGPIDFTKASDIWVESSRWKGIFPVEWLIIREIPNRLLRHLRVYSNENKPVANSRDTQELPFDIGIAMMGTFDTFAE